MLPTHKPKKMSAPQTLANGYIAYVQPDKWTDMIPAAERLP